MSEKRGPWWLRVVFDTLSAFVDGLREKAYPTVDEVTRDTFKIEQYPILPEWGPGLKAVLVDGVPHYPNAPGVVTKWDVWDEKNFGYHPDYKPTVNIAAAKLDWETADAVKLVCATVLIKEFDETARHLYIAAEIPCEEA
jgi:hypothetical protein